jgi:type I restriction enzyme S subunit
VLPFVPCKELSRNIYWLHWATKDLVVFNDYKGHWPEFTSRKVIVPPKDLTEKFGAFVQPSVWAAYALQRKNEILRKSRDLILPKLFSGQLNVEDLDIDTGETVTE